MRHTHAAECRRPFARDEAESWDGRRCVDGRKVQLRPPGFDGSTAVCPGIGFEIQAVGSVQSEVRGERGTAERGVAAHGGSHAAMCGNAALCSTTLAAHLGLDTPDGLDLETDAGTYRSRAIETGRAELHLAPIDAPAAVPGLSLVSSERPAALSRVGVPHLIVLVDNVDKVALQARGRALRFDAGLAPEGANVNFIAQDEAGAWRMRTYERGIEGETLACGTGAVGAGCAIQEWGLGQLPINIQSRSGRILGVRATKAQSGRYDDVWLAGEGRMVFRGVIT